MATIDRLRQQRIALDDKIARAEARAAQVKEKAFASIRTAMLKASITMQDLNEHAGNGQQRAAPKVPKRGKTSPEPQQPEVKVKPKAKPKLTPRKPATERKLRAVKVGVPKFRDPETGKTWTGVGKRPNWYMKATEGGRSDDHLKAA